MREREGEGERVNVEERERGYGRGREISISSSDNSRNEPSTGKTTALLLDVCKMTVRNARPTYLCACVYVI